VVVDVGLTVVEPLANVEVNDPGVMEILVAPVEDQLRVVLEPEGMVAEAAVKEEMFGAELFVEVEEVAAAQPSRPTQSSKTSVTAQSCLTVLCGPRGVSRFAENKLGESMHSPSVVADQNSLVIEDSRCLLV